MRRRLLLGGVLVLLGAGCTADQWQRFPSPDDVVAAVPWFAVMHRGIAIQPYKMPRMPVEGTVPITGSTAVVQPTVANRPLLDRLRNPVARTAQSLERGKDRFQIYCQVCHGPEARGDGPVSAAMGGVVRNLQLPQMKQITDGWMFGVISGGFGLMPEYGSKLTPEDRWNIVNYVRLLQGASP